MKSEEDPISDDEWLLRRVPADRIRTDKLPMISPNAFEPRVKGRDPDTDGISLFRAECLANPAEVLEPVVPERRHEFGIVRIKVSFLKSLNLSVMKTHDARVKGHVVIPELNASDYQADKGRYTPFKVKLATEASKDENIVRHPERSQEQGGQERHRQGS